VACSTAKTQFVLASQNRFWRQQIHSSGSHKTGGEIKSSCLHATTNTQDEDVDEAEEEGEDEGLLAKDGQRLCEQLEKLCLHHSDADGVLTLALQQQLRKLRAHLHQLEFASQTQVTLDKFWGAPFSSTTSITS